MALKTVTGKLTRADGTPVKGAKVRARLSAQAVVAGTEEVALLNVYGNDTGDDGSWTLPTLQANLDLTPNTTYYTFYIGDNWSATGVVPQTGSTHIIEDIMTAPPTVSPPGALDSQVVHLALTEHITGQKIYDTNPVLNAGALPESAVASLVTDLATLTSGVAAAAVDSTVLHKALAETVTGVKHFSAAPVFDAGFSVSAGLASFAAGLTVSAGAVTLPANAIVDAAINSLSASKLTGSNTLPDGVLSTNVALLGTSQTFTGTPVFALGATFSAGAGVVAFASGDDVPYFVNGTAWEMDARQGTAGSPITLGSGPTFKISRTESITAASMPSGNGSNNQGNAGLWVSAKGDANNETQISAGFFTSQNASTKTRTPPSVNVDACGVQGFGEILAGGTGNGIGAYLEGRVDSVAVGAGANGAEVRVNNNSGADNSFNATGLSVTTGLWMTPGSSTAGRVSGVAFSTGVTNSCQWDTGLGFTVVGGVSSIKTTTYNDASNSTNSILISGTHTRAIGVKTGSGPILIGHTNATDAASNANALIEAFTTSTSARGLISNQGSGSTAELSYKLGNSAGSAEWFVVGTAGHFFTSSVQGDTGIIVNSAGKRFLLGGTTQVIQVGVGNTLGFFGTSEITQYNTTATSTGFTAGAGTTVTHLSTFTGNTGSTAYTIGDIVRALKLYGLMAA